MSRQRFLYCHQDGHDKSQVLQQIWPWVGILCRKCFSVTTEFGQDQGFSCHDKLFVYHDRFFQGGEVLCRDIEFDVVTRLPEIVSR